MQCCLALINQCFLTFKRLEHKQNFGRDQLLLGPTAAWILTYQGVRRVASVGLQKKNWINKIPEEPEENRTGFAICPS